MLYTMNNMILSDDPNSGIMPTGWVGGGGFYYAQLCNVMGAQHQAMSENGKNYVDYMTKLSDCNASIIQGRPQPAPPKPLWLSVLDKPAPNKNPNLSLEDQPEPGTPIWVSGPWPSYAPILPDPIVVTPVPGHMTGMIQQVG